MKFADLFIGALTLKHRTFVSLRDNSEAFRRGFMVLLVAALVAGAFTSLVSAVQNASVANNKAQVIESAVSSFRSTYRGPAEMESVIESYIREGIGIGLDIAALPPRAGQGARPIAAILDYIGNVLSTPFHAGWTGWLLLAGLLVHFSSRLLGGRASIAQMLGLTSLAAAPHIFSALTALLTLAGPLGAVNSLLGFLISIWSLIVYIKATAVAQNFSAGRAIGAIAIGFLILIGIAILISILVGLIVGGFIATAVSQTR